METTLQLTKEEITYLISVFNGVECTVSTFIPNVIEAFEYPQGVDIKDKTELLNKLKNMNSNEISELHSKIIDFWNSPNYHISNTEQRMKEVGLI